MTSPWQTIAERVAAERPDDALLTAHLAQALSQLANARAAGELPRERTADELVDFARVLLEAQVSFAPVCNLITQALFTVQTATESTAMGDGLHTVAASFESSANEYAQAVQQKAAALLPVGVVVFTHGRSSLVRATLRTAVERDRRPRVIVTEARPWLSGYEMAKDLAEDGIVATVVLDGTAPRHMQDAELAILAADTFCDVGVVAAAGTASVAAAAARRNVPVYVLGDHYRIWPHTLGPVPLVDLSGALSWPERSVDVNMHFEPMDVTPWRDVAGVVTNAGLKTGDEIRRASNDMAGHPRLLDAIARVGAGR